MRSLAAVAFMARLLSMSTLAQAAPQTHEPQFVHSPTIVEFDGIFPVGGETYSPASVFPLVLAVQNATAALALRPQVFWYLMKLPEDMQRVSIEDLHLLLKSPALESGIMTDLGWSLPDGAPSNYTFSGTGDEKDVYYYTAWTGMLNDTTPEGVYSIAWLIDYVNCTDTKDPGWQFDSTGLSKSPSMLVVYDTFSISYDKEAKKPDLNELAAEPDCKPGSLGAFKVLGETWMDKGHNGTGYHVCAQLADWGTFPLARDSWCQAKLGPEDAARIEAGKPTRFNEPAAVATATTATTALTPAATTTAGGLDSAPEEVKKESRAPSSSSSGWWIAAGMGIMMLFVV